MAYDSKSLTSTVFPDCVWIMIQSFSIGFLVAQLVKNPLASAGDTRDEGSIPRSGRSPGKGNGHLLQYSCLENVMLWGAWGAAVHGVARVRHDWAHTYTHTHTHTQKFLHGVSRVMMWFILWVAHRDHLFVTPWTAACQALLFFTVSQGLLRFMSIESLASAALCSFCL